MTNNDILKKLRVALQLRDEQIVEILSLVDFRISKGEIGNFFRNEEHPKYVECQDQILRNFLNGLVIFLRGTKENPKDPNTVLATIAENKKPLTTAKTKSSEVKKVTQSVNKKVTKPTNVTKPKNKTQKDIMGNVKFNNGKTKKKN